MYIYLYIYIYIYPSRPGPRDDSAPRRGDRCGSEADLGPGDPREAPGVVGQRGVLLLLLVLTVFTALLERADKYRDRAVLALRAHVLPPPRVRLCRRCAFAFAAARPPRASAFAAARWPLHSHSFKFF